MDNKQEIQEKIRVLYDKSEGEYFESSLTPYDIVDIFQRKKSELESCMRSGSWILKKSYDHLIEMERILAYESIQCHFNIDLNNNYVERMTKEEKNLWYSRLK